MITGLNEIKSQQSTIEAPIYAADDSAGSTSTPFLIRRAFHIYLRTGHIQYIRSAMRICKRWHAGYCNGKPSGQTKSMPTISKTHENKVFCKTKNIVTKL